MHPVLAKTVTTSGKSHAAVGIGRLLDAIIKTEELDLIRSSTEESVISGDGNIAEAENYVAQVFKQISGNLSSANCLKEKPNGRSTG